MKEATLTFKTAYRNEDHHWHQEENAKITTIGNLSKIQHVLDQIGSIVIEHWIYCGSQAPSRAVFDGYEDFIEYLTDNANAGDIIDVWSLHELINNENKLVSGKCPAEDGCTPKSGTY